MPSPARIRSTIATIKDPPQDLRSMAAANKAGAIRSCESCHENYRLEDD